MRLKVVSGKIYPAFVLRKDSKESNILIELTEKEFDNYKRVEKEWSEWQEWLEKCHDTDLVAADVVKA